MMKDDFLDQLASKAKKIEDRHTDNPYKKKETARRTISIRLSVYKELREYAFRNEKSISDVASDIISSELEKLINGHM
ncbi:hypothetical protein OZX69_09755 (plasmid) [Lactobacillus sp. ESL0731]|uniref:hypothetical protein n=1 Tax=unclassified Lactobacillus TaxID=2620435 RepID=UPI0023F62FFD|nr:MULTISPECIES: hypothetical protein [unclassified Lactobacillus]WEV52072.1 hypothetical protein OZX63_09570 [Lactobacillus sp. ESL0700]WEV63237.1 hypothetical protein OZX69_09755 [Lactobacillus sp. ESL0731]